MNRKCLWICLVVFACLCTFSGRAQVSTAQLGGSVTDPQNAVIPSANVRLVSVSQGTSTETRSNRAGQFIFPAILPGLYKIFVQADGFETLVADNITLNVGDNKQMVFQLKVGSSAQSITVDGSGLTINTTDASVSTIIDRQFVENMPLNGRSFQTLLTLAPGTAQVPSSVLGRQGEITVNGQRSEANTFEVDGVSSNGGTYAATQLGGAAISGNLPVETVLGTTQSMVSIDALQEFRATTSTYSAEYGRTPGGQYSLSTRSGTNRVTGSAFDYFRNTVMDANNWFNNYATPPVARQAEHQNDFGGVFGGPLLIPGLYNGRDKTFFFFSYEGLRLLVPQAYVQDYVPDSSLRQSAAPALQPFINALPAANGAEDGFNDGLAYFGLVYSAPSRLDNFGLRIDHSFGSRLNIFGRYADTPSNSWTYDAASFYPSTRGTTAARTQSLTLGATSVFSNSQSNELRFNFTRNKLSLITTGEPVGGATPFGASNVFPGSTSSGLGQEATFYMTFSGRTSGASFGDNENTQHQYTVTDSYLLTHGAHQFKFGIDWRRLGTYVVPVTQYEFSEYTSESQVISNAAAEVLYSQFTSQPVEPVFLNFSAYAQDEWKATRKLSLSLGLRWDINPAPTNAIGNSPYTVTQITDLATTQLAPANTPLWQTDWAGFAPRFGLAYQVHEGERNGTVLRAGMGVFYDTGNEQATQGFSQSVGFATIKTFLGAAFPLTQLQIASVPAPSTSTPYNDYVYGYDPHLRLPYTEQWNVAVEQALGPKQSLTMNYVGSEGHKLLAQFEYFPGKIGNPNFGTTYPLLITANRADSNYHSAQVKYERQISNGLQALASYTWSHSIDDASTNFEILDMLLRSSSDFDIRHNLQAALTYNVPGKYDNSVASALLTGWGLDSRISIRSALPLDIIGATSIDPTTEQEEYFHPNFVAGQPLYVSSLASCSPTSSVTSPAAAPGHRLVNFCAFTAAASGVNGNVPRNYARDFDAVQMDLALRRDFPLRDRLHLNFRAEAFNVFNHPIFGAIYNQLAYGPTRFGYSYNMLNAQLAGLNTLYQSGGPRSLQLMLKLAF